MAADRLAAGDDTPAALSRPSRWDRLSRVDVAARGGTELAACEEGAQATLEPLLPALQPAADESTPREAMFRQRVQLLLRQDLVDQCILGPRVRGRARAGQALQAFERHDTHTSLPLPIPSPGRHPRGPCAPDGHLYARPLWRTRILVLHLRGGKHG